MTEYTTSSEAIREFMSARERTGYWVETYRQRYTGDVLLSPTSPPSLLDDEDGPSYGPTDSDNESSHSLPPRMVLRWDDGRPDVPIPYGEYSSRSLSRPRSTKPGPSHVPASDHVRSQPLAIPNAHPHRSRHAQTLSYVTDPQGNSGHNPISQSPESIVVLPSRESEQSSQTSPQGAHPPASSSHHRNDGHSRAPTHHSSHHSSRVASPTPRVPYSSSHHEPPRVSRSPPVMYSQSQPLPMSTSGGVRYLEQRAAAQSRASSQLPYNYSPPAIIYAPSSKHSQSRYSPPAIVYSPPSHSHNSNRYTPPSMTHSHSVPPSNGGSYPDPAHAGPRSRATSQHRSQASAAAYEDTPRGHPRNPSHHSQARSQSRGRSIGSDVREEMEVPRTSSQRSRSRGRFFGRLGSRSRSPALSDAGSVSSSGTYYILPTPGQKVQIIVPNGKSSTYTATTTTANSPQSYTSPRKPFFQRIFAIPKFSSSVDSRTSASKKLQRRHTIGGAHLRHQHDATAAN